MRRQQGFTYLAVLFMVAIAGAGLAKLGTQWSIDRKREKEQLLLFVGHQYREAIRQYYETAPGSEHVYPKALDDLLEDKRFVTTVRHLRRKYPDPITGSSNWGLVLNQDGRITGVYSLSTAKPMKTGNFDPEDASFVGAAAYADWRFVYQPPN